MSDCRFSVSPVNYPDPDLNLGIRILGQNNKENVDLTETQSTFCLGVAFERPF